MKRLLLPLFSTLIITLLLSSCIEIREILTINKNGSGTFSMVIDMSEMKALLESFSEEGEETAETPLAEMENEFEVTKSKLENVEGISNITFQQENDGYVVTTSFDFENMEALNNGMNIVYEEENEYGEKTKYYAFKKKNFERTPAHNLLDQLKEEMSSDEMDEEAIDVAAMFSEVAYINVITFNDQVIKKASSDAIEISEDGSTMTLKRFVFKEDEDVSMNYKLKLK